jgi:transposase
MDVPPNIRSLIVSHHKDGHSGRKIAEMVHLARETVRNIIKRYRESGSFQTNRVGRCGRPRMLSLRDERTLARASIVNPKLTAREIRGTVGGTSVTASIRTVQRVLCRQDRKAIRPKKSPSLNLAQQKVRLRWCQTHEWEENRWRKVDVHKLFKTRILGVLDAILISGHLF